ncbi:AhpC-TSA-domain-containing protein [Crucibulum laeve]|uniref:thioredoxin-dependent peroxiredoxin n=1 Tax=Crucibulum laeve TaxID=68775 RepID=A0A5C3LWC3_9AGAR|nr:AhpC-TSA-domain-containing protein [Crucibulum laeve]
MPPRKTAETTDAEPRRSTRIASLPKEEVAPGPIRKASSSKKRAAEPAEDGKEGESSAAKKVLKAKPDIEEGDGEVTVDAEITSDNKLTPIDIGDVLPTLTLKNEKNEDIEVADLAAEKGVIFFLVPKADTPGCTTQACGFRDIYPDFESLNYTVYCLSADTSAAQMKWQTKKTLPYPLISDPKRILIRALGAGDGNKTKRSHFIFEKGGKLVDKKIPVKPADSPKLALEFIKSQS